MQKAQVGNQKANKGREDQVQYTKNSKCCLNKLWCLFVVRRKKKSKKPPCAKLRRYLSPLFRPPFGVGSLTKRAN